MKSLTDKIPALLPLLGWIAGIVLWTASVAWWLAVAAAAVGIVLFLLRQHVAAFALYTCAFGWGAAALNAPTPPDTLAIDGETHLLGGEITSVSNSYNSLQLRVRVDSVDGRAVAPFVIRVSSVPEWMPPQAGSTVSLRTPLLEADTFSDLPGEESRYLANLESGIVADAFVSNENMKITGFSGGFRSWADGRRRAFLSLLARAGLDDNAFGILAALTVGYTDEIPADTRSGFRAAGIAHILALSGFHIGVIVLLVSLVLWPLRAWTRLRNYRLLLGVALAWGYTAIVGFPLSASRAMIMLTVYTLSLVAGRSANSFNSLCVSLLIILAVCPFSMYSASLQLSVSAVLGLLCFSGPLNPVSPRRHKMRTAVSVVTTPVAALLGTMCVTVFYFHSLPLLFLLSNIVIALLLPLLMVLAILIALSSALGLTIPLLTSAANVLTQGITDFCNSMASQPIAEIDGIYLAPVAMIAIAVTIVTGAVAVNVNKRPAFIALAAMVLISPVAGSISAAGVDAPPVAMSRHRDMTLLIVTDGDSAVAYTTLSRLDSASMARIDRYTAGFRARHALKHLSVSESDMAGTPVGLIAIPRRIAKADTEACDTVKYVLVGRRFSGKAAALLRRYKTDTVLIAPDYPRNRAGRLLDSLRSHRIPVIDLAERPWKP